MLYNIYRLYLIKIAKWFSLIMPIVVLFYNENDLAQFDILLLQGVYSVSIVLLEIPSGYMADALGRKNTLLIGSILGFLGFTIYSISYGFWTFLAAEIILGIGQSLISGADSAMLYDSLQARNRQKEYLKFEGRIMSIGNFAEAIAGILGGLLATISLRTPYYFQCGVAFLAIPAAFTLIEPARANLKNKIRFRDIIKIFRHALHDNKTLRQAIVFSSLIGSATLSMAWFVQPYLKIIGLPTPLFGVLWTLLNLSVGITSLFAYKIEQKLNKKQVFMFITLAISGLYFLSGNFQAYWAIGFLFLFYLVRGIATPILKDYINQQTSSEMRATVLSIRNFMIRFIFAGIGPLLGWYTDNYSLKTALCTAGGFYFIGGILIILILKPHKRVNIQLP